MYCFIELSATDKNDNLTREVIYGNFTHVIMADSALCFNATVFWGQFGG